jgi:hypothetical protein
MIFVNLRLDVWLTSKDIFLLIIKYDHIETKMIRTNNFKLVTSFIQVNVRWVFLSPSFFFSFTVLSRLSRLISQVILMATEHQIDKHIGNNQFRISSVITPLEYVCSTSPTTTSNSANNNRSTSEKSIYMENRCWYN